MSQIYIKRNRDGKDVLIAAKVTEDILLAVRIPELNDFTKAICKRYKVKKIIIGDTIKFNGFDIYKYNEGNTTMDMTNFLSKIKPIVVDNARTKQSNMKATQAEIYMYRSLAGSLLLLGSAVTPQAS